MAQLTATELTRLRNDLEKGFFGTIYTKAQINMALQAVEDVITTRAIIAGDVGKTVPQLVSAAIDTSGVSFSAGQKKRIFALWAELKFERDQ